MTVVPIRPQVDLTFSDISAEALHHVDQSHLGTPEEVIRGALMSYRLLVINHVKMEIANTTRLNTKKLLQLIDTAGQLYLGRFNRLVGPAAAASYLRAYKAAGAGDVPMSTIYALAEQHSARMGEYFNETSKEALVQGFNTFVNQRVPVRVAADRALDAFGLTPRQMSGYTSTRVAGKVSSAQEIPWRGKVTDYINRSLHDRFQVFATQEAHNLDQQAQQTAWMWLQNKGAISEVAEKVWITARDERVCPECGPMHGKRVPVTARFKMPSGGQLYVPGAHPRCRCEARLVDPVQLVRKDLRGGELEHFNREHPRDESGRFSAKARAQATLQERARNRSTIFREVGFGDRPSPGLEQMVAEAERLRESTPVIETDARQELSSPQQLGVQQSLGRRQSFGRQQSLSGAGQQEMSTQQILGGQQEATSQRREMGRRAELVAANRPALENNVQTLLNAVRTTPPKTRRQRHFRYWVQDVKDEHGNPMNVYALADPGERSIHDDVVLTANRVFTPDLGLVQKQAVDRMEANQYSALHRIEDRYQNAYVHHKYGQVQVDDDEVWNVVGWVVSQATGYPAKDDYVQYDAMGRELPYDAQLKYSDLAMEWELDPEDFAITIFRVSSGHDSSLGSTDPGSGSKYGHEYWRFTGNFKASFAPNETFKHTAFQMYDLEPDVEPIEYFEDE